MKSLILFVSLFLVGNAAVPPNFKRCLRKDPDFKKCYKKAAQYGASLLTKPYKQLDIPIVDPLEVTSLALNSGGGAVNLQHNYTKCLIYGLSTIKFDKFELDLEKKTLTEDGIIDEMLFKCHYQMTGKVLLLSVQGEGASTLTFNKFRSQYTAKFEEYTKNDKTYFKTVNSDLKSETGHVHFHYDNLFNGIKELGDNINLVINDNWKEVFADIEPKYNEIVKHIMTNIMVKIWDSTSLEEFFD